MAIEQQSKMPLTNSLRARCAAPLLAHDFLLFVASNVIHSGD
jgi:hypothetical protein